MNATATYDYVNRQEHIIFPSSVAEQIERLSKAPLGLPDAAYDLTDDEEEELAALVAFRAAAESATGKSFDDVTIVPEDDFAEFARDWASSLADIEFLDTYVDWERFGNALKLDYKPVDFGGDTVYVK